MASLSASAPATCIVSHSRSPLAVMSSFIFIGDIYAGENLYLLNNVLRDEWGFEGMVMTDWNGSYGYLQTGMDPMTRMFVDIDVIVAAAAIEIMAIVMICWRRKKGE